MIATSRRARLLLRRVAGQHGDGSGNEIAVAVGYAPVGQHGRIFQTGPDAVPARDLRAD